ncbi:kinesin light chain [Colletotrichum truncatum]|uniref:Kinesin light chain n=1 Tax=Colletotrichum truncatum TaxID=5467 RepID=A0ACC3YDP7_COLTU
MPKPITARDFTIGWICTVPIELAAAIEIMDEEYAELPSQQQDPNVYCFGRIGVHNVVAACLPAGQTGTNKAAIIASHMKQSFPSLLFNILVGIGSGVPSLEDDIDIRLGDVVISQPNGQHGGVIQYDFGKTGANGRIARTGSLNAPSTILLDALAKLRANDNRGKTRIITHLSQLANKPRFISPGPDNDTLYYASSPHAAGATCAKCRLEDRVDREPRESNKPVLFFGNIASGKQVIKDGLTRDRYSQQLGGILCFEMEAAGLINTLDCVVVRGICDYADAHMNKQWQPYAAATAAACGKELLTTIPPLVPKTDCKRYKNLRNPHFMIPFGRNESFIGRDVILTRLLHEIPPAANKDTCQRTTVVGLGGIGKTQVAIEAAYRIRDVHPDCSIFWVPAVDMVLFENAYREIGRALNIEELEEDEADVKSLVKTVLEREDVNSWLLIVDNADDMDLLFTGPKLATYLPFNRKGSILLTTRNLKAAVRFSHPRVIRLSEMGVVEATQLLQTGLDKFQISGAQETTQLLEHLLYLPLAIRQASAYIASNKDMTVSKFLGYWKANDDYLGKLLSKDFNDDHYQYEATQNPVTTLQSTTKLSIDTRTVSTESYSNASVASQIFSGDLVSTKPSSIQPNINAVDEDIATRQMAEIFYSHTKIESNSNDASDEIKSLLSESEDIQSKDESNITRWEVREAAASYLAEMLTDDPTLGPLYAEASKLLDDVRFFRNHGRLLKRYYLSLRSQASSRKLSVAIDFLRPRSHRSLISRKILENTGRKRVHVALPEANERNLILERYLNGVEVQPDVVETPLDVDESSGREISEDEIEDDQDGFSLLDLDYARSYFVSGTPLICFKVEFRDFLNLSKKDVEEVQDETQKQTQEAKQWGNTKRQSLYYGVTYWKSRLFSRLYDAWFLPRPGYQRIRYICVRG